MSVETLYTNEMIRLKVAGLENEIQELVGYMQLKIKQKDWHGVADSAMDIRDLEAKIEVLVEMFKI